MKRILAALPLLLAMSLQAYEPIKVDMVAGLSPGDELTVSAEGGDYRVGQAVSLVEREGGADVIHGIVVGRVTGGKLKIRVVPAPN
ncbi:hypothetical protein [Spongiibacter sp.]|uniref:hypothetical protein n=1 Tax=Spongiibacter sp. TaxID=2024860 RepID=UPI003564B039